MGRLPHKTKTQRRLITYTEWGDFLRMDRRKVRAIITRYNSNVDTYDPTDILSMLNFYRWLIQQLFKEQVI